MDLRSVSADFRMLVAASPLPMNLPDTEIHEIQNISNTLRRNTSSPPSVQRIFKHLKNVSICSSEDKQIFSPFEQELGNETSQSVLNHMKAPEGFSNKSPDMNDVEEAIPTSILPSDGKQSERSNENNSTDEQSQSDQEKEVVPINEEPIEVETVTESVKKDVGEEYDNDDQVTSIPKETTLTSWTIRPLSGGSMCVEGFRENSQDDGYWHSSAITSRISSRSVATASGSIYKLKGPIDKEVSKCYEIPSVLLSKFKNGFPPAWKELWQNVMFGSQSQTAVKDNTTPKTKQPLETGDATLEDMKTPTRPEDETIDSPKKKKKNGSKARFKVGQTVDSGAIDLNCLPTTRSGRRVLPPLAWWTGQRLFRNDRLGCCYIDAGSPNQLLGIEVPEVKKDEKEQARQSRYLSKYRRKGKRVASSINIDDSGSDDSNSGQSDDDNTSATKPLITDTAPPGAENNTAPTTSIAKSLLKTERCSTKRIKPVFIGETSDQHIDGSKSDRRDSEKPASVTKTPIYHTAPPIAENKTAPNTTEAKSRLITAKRTTRRLQLLATSETSEQDIESKSSDADRRGKYRRVGVNKRSRTQSADEARPVLRKLPKEKKFNSEPRTRKRVVPLSYKQVIEDDFLLNSPEVRLKPIRSSRNVSKRARLKPANTALTKPPLGCKRVELNDDSAIESEISIEEQQPRASADSIGSDDDFPSLSRAPSRGRIRTDNITPQKRNFKDKKQVGYGDVDTERNVNKSSRKVLKRRAKTRSNSTEIEHLNVDDEDDESVHAIKHKPKRQKLDKVKDPVPERKQEKVKASKRWNEEEKDKLSRAMIDIPRHVEEFWSIVSLMVKTRSSDECRAYYQQGSGTSNVKQPKKLSKSVLSDGLIGGVGTLKRKRQLRELIENHNKDHNDELFDSTPFKKRDKLCNLGLRDISDSEVFKSQSSRNVTPGVRTPVSWIPSSLRKKTPETFITPERFNSMENQNAADRFINRCKRGKRHFGTSHQSFKEPILRGQTLKSRNGTNTALFTLTEEVSQDPDDEEEDFYFSDYD